jgi:hypothetical protein
MDDSDGLGVFFFWLAAMGGLVIWTSWDSDNFIAKLRHKFAYDVPYANVHINTRPKDCDFFGSPIGMKSCRYVPAVTTRNNAGHVLEVDGKPIDGSFFRALLDKVASVEVRWLKVTD